jgi:hypothetical protein
VALMIELEADRPVQRLDGATPGAGIHWIVTTQAETVMPGFAPVGRAGAYTLWHRGGT